MKKIAILAALVLALASCGGAESDGGAGGDGNRAATTAPSGDDGGGSGATTTATSGGAQGSPGGGDIVDRQPPGQAIASVDGREYTFTEPGGVACSITEDSISFSFRIGDNDITIGGGANLYDTGWLGGFDLIVWNPEDEENPIDYAPNLGDNGDKVVVDGDSMSYSGPMHRNDPDDPTNLEGVQVGDGTISVTCG